MFSCLECRVQYRVTAQPPRALEHPWGPSRSCARCLCCGCVAMFGHLLLSPGLAALLCLLSGPEGQAPVGSRPIAARGAAEMGSQVAAPTLPGHSRWHAGPPRDMVIAAHDSAVPCSLPQCLAFRPPSLVHRCAHLQGSGKRGPRGWSPSPVPRCWAGRGSSMQGCWGKCSPLSWEAPLVKATASTSC